MRRRAVVMAAIGASVPGVAAPAASDWRQSRGYPSGWGADQDWNADSHRIGNFSGGHEKMFRAGTIKAGAGASPLQSVPGGGGWLASVASEADEYLKDWPVTGLLIARKGKVLLERYQFDRTAQMRMTSWSLAKSVTSLLLGICLDRGLVRSMDDPAEAYVPQLAGRLHGAVTLRNLCNMSSGADVVQERDNPVIYQKALLRSDSDLEAMVRDWNARSEPQGLRFNYNELAALTIGMVIRAVTGRSLCEFCQEALWQPMGAEADASWLRDSKLREFNCTGFAARLRDWARLGQLIAQDGVMQGRQVVSSAWIGECASWSSRDRQVRHGTAMRERGYKYFFWHPRPDGRWPMMGGAHGQCVLVDRETQTVLVQTAADVGGAWQSRLFELFDSALKVQA